MSLGGGLAKGKLLSGSTVRTEAKKLLSISALSSSLVMFLPFSVKVSTVWEEREKWRV